MPTRAVTASLRDRKAKTVFLVSARDRPTVQYDECDRVTASNGATVRLAGRTGRRQSFSLETVHEDRSQPVRVLECRSDALEAWQACSASADPELLKAANDAVMLDRYDIVREIEFGPLQPSAHRAADQTFGL
jgi:hypothetical protein